jgi:pimeloyl-ACP methyl ester carboxylesterase
VTVATNLLPGFESRDLRVSGVPLRYYVRGAGKPIVLVHGLGGAATNWAEVASPLASRHRVIVVDLPGHADSPPLPAPATMAQFGDRVGAVIDHEALGPALLVGHSLGAVVVVRLAARRPAAVRGLVLAAGAGIESTTRRAKMILSVTTVVQPGRVAGRFALRIARRPRLRTLSFGGWGAADAHAISPRAAEGFLVGPPRHSALRDAARALLVDDPRQDLERISCPALVLWGARDWQLPMSDAFEYARRLRAPLRTIAGCGHLLIGERPDACVDAIDRFELSLEA